MKLSQKQAQHLLWRAGLFESLPQIQKWTGKEVSDLWNHLIRSSRTFEPLEVLKKSSFDFLAFRQMSPQEKKQLFQKTKENILQLNKLWLDEMADTKAVFRERMALFWHNHFACTSRNVFFLQGYLNTIRKHSIGNFRDLLHAVSKEPAMLQYLNNQQNRKRSPNENFAREVMELFTLGRGNYTEQDVKNAARAFTGWSFNQEGTYLLRRRQHDDGTKEIFGRRGQFTGEEVLDILLERKETAEYVTRKIYRYFVNDQVDEKRVRELAARFYEMDYNIADLMGHIFLSDWFYDAQNIGAKIKSPIDLLTGIRRSMHVSFDKPEGTIFIQKVLGQTLLDPPNVAGWPGGQQWIDSSTLLFRSRLVEIILLAAEIGVDARDGGDDNAQFKIRGKLKQLGAKGDLRKLEKELSGTRKVVSKPSIEQFLLQATPANLSNPANGSQHQDLQQVIVSISKTPEFQLC